MTRDESRCYTKLGILIQDYKHRKSLSIPVLATGTDKSQIVLLWHAEGKEEIREFPMCTIEKFHELFAGHEPNKVSVLFVGRAQDWEMPDGASNAKYAEMDSLLKRRSYGDNEGGFIVYATCPIRKSEIASKGVREIFPLALDQDEPPPLPFCVTKTTTWKHSRQIRLHNEMIY